MRIAVGVGALAIAAVLFVPTGANASATGDPVRPTPPASDSAFPSDTKLRTFAYGPHIRQRMDVWWHPEGDARPAVFVVHGGWWAGGDKNHMTQVSQSYVDLGYTVVNINYRLSRDASWPAQRTDAIDAIATMRRNAARFNMDPDRYVIIGFSAGGHIAASVGTYGDGLPGLRGVVGVSPVISPLTAYADGDEGADLEQRKLRKAAIALAGGCGPTECPRTWSSMEVPFHATPGDAPVLTVHSTDEFVPPYQSELLQQTLGDVGVEVIIRTVPGNQHSAPLYRVPGVADHIRSWIIAKLVG